MFAAISAQTVQSSVASNIGRYFAMLVVGHQGPFLLTQKKTCETSSSNTKIPESVQRYLSKYQKICFTSQHLTFLRKKSAISVSGGGFWESFLPFTLASPATQPTQRSYLDFPSFAFSMGTLNHGKSRLEKKGSLNFQLQLWCSFLSIFLQVFVKVCVP